MICGHSNEQIIVIGVCKFGYNLELMIQFNKNDRPLNSRSLLPGKIPVLRKLIMCTSIQFHMYICVNRKAYLRKEIRAFRSLFQTLH